MFAQGFIFIFAPEYTNRYFESRLKGWLAGISNRPFHRYEWLSFNHPPLLLHLCLRLFLHTLWRTWKGIQVLIPLIPCRLVLLLLVRSNERIRNWTYLDASVSKTNLAQWQSFDMSGLGYFLPLSRHSSNICVSAFFQGRKFDSATCL